MPQTYTMSVSNDLFEEIPAGICLFQMNPQLTILAANEWFYNLFGYSKEKALQEGFDSIFFLLTEEEKERVRMHLKWLKDGNLPEKGELELSVQHPNGKNVVVLAHYYYQGAGSDRVTVNVVDITDRKRMEDELRVGEKRYRLALCQSGKVFFFFDVKTRTMHISDELSQKSGLPLEVDDMPNNPMALCLLEPESVATYQEFYHKIIAGEETGEAIISCHTRTEPERVLWFKIAFTTVFNSEGQPTSTIITFEEFTEQYRSIIAAKWQQTSIAALSGETYLLAEYDLTTGVRHSVVGNMEGVFDRDEPTYDILYDGAFKGIVHEEDAAAYREFLDRERLMAQFAQGMVEESLECRMMQRSKEYQWVRITIKMLYDSYTDHVLALVQFRNIHEEMLGQLRIKKNMEELQRKLEASRIKAMVNQMQPHFLYNALSAIRTIIRKDPEQAYHLLYDFTIHLRSSIKALSSDALIPFSDELKNIKAYLNIEKMRFEDRLQVEYEIDCENFMVVPLSIQPLAENAAKHGVYNKGTAGTITIRSYEAVDAYVVEVEDDGNGFDVQQALEEDNGSYGLKNLIFRLDVLLGAKVEIQSNIGQGTLIRIRFPKKG